MASTWLLVFLEHLVLHGVAVLGIDGAFLGHEVADVPVGGEHFEILAKVFLDGLRLGGRFDDDQVVCHCLLNIPDPPKTKNRGRTAAVSDCAARFQCGTLGRASDTRSSRRSNANSCPG